MKILLASLCTGIALVAAPIAQVTVADAGHPLKSDGTYYVGPYDLRIGTRTAAALCIDVEDQSKVGAHWAAAISNLSGSLAATYQPGELVKYEEEAYLFTLITRPGADRIGLQHAAWALLDLNFAADPTAKKWVIEASKEYRTIDLAGFAIVSEVAGYKGARMQEFLTAAVPEPSLINFFGGLIAIGLVLLGKRRG